MTWRDRCELDLVAETCTLRLRVLRCRQPRAATQSVDSVVGTCEIAVDQLEASDRAVSWGWHRIVGPQDSGEIYLGIERFRVSDEEDMDAVAVKEDRGTMPDATLAETGEVEHDQEEAQVPDTVDAEAQPPPTLPDKSVSLQGLVPPEKAAEVAAAVATGTSGHVEDHDHQPPREGAASLYGKRRPPARQPAAGAGRGEGDGHGIQPARISDPGGGAGAYDARQAAQGHGLSPAQVAGLNPDRLLSQQLSLDALFPLKGVSRSASRLTPAGQAPSVRASPWVGQGWPSSGGVSLAPASTALRGLGAGGEGIAEGGAEDPHKAAFYAGVAPNAPWASHAAYRLDGLSGLDALDSRKVGRGDWTNQSAATLLLG